LIKPAARSSRHSSVDPHFRTIAGDPGNSFYLQPFVNYNFGPGWYFTTDPTITAAWNLPIASVTSAPEDVPIGVGFGKQKSRGGYSCGGPSD
jgi:hypothetical protein